MFRDAGIGSRHEKIQELKTLLAVRARTPKQEAATRRRFKKVTFAVTDALPEDNKMPDVVQLGKRLLGVVKAIAKQYSNILQQHVNQTLHNNCKILQCRAQQINMKKKQTH